MMFALFFQSQTDAVAGTGPSPKGPSPDTR